MIANSKFLDKLPLVAISVELLSPIKAQQAL